LHFSFEHPGRSKLEIIRPGGERLVDQLMVSEELTGKDLRTLAREYISSISSPEILYNSRQSSLFDLMTPFLQKSISEVEKEVVDLNIV
jgi:hypothetical protein